MYNNRNEMEKFLGFSGNFMGGWVLGSIIGSVIANIFGIWFAYRILKWVLGAMFGDM